LEWHRKASSLGRISLCVALSLVAGWACGEDPEGSDSSGPARIVSFSLLPNELEEPGMVKVSWQTSNAETLFLIRNGDLVPVDGVPLAVGSVDVHVDRTSTFELVVTGEVGAAAKETRTVTLPGDVVPPPAIGSFTGPEAVGADELGDALVRLEWADVAGATELVLEADTQNPRTLEVGDGSGSIELVIDEDTTFELVARNAGGEERSSVSVRVVPMPTIEVLTTDRSWVGAADLVEVQWSTAGAVGIELWINDLRFESVDPSATSGSVVLSPAADSAIELRAFSELGTVATAGTSVRVAAPEIVSLTGNSTSLWLGERLTLSWTSMGGNEFMVTTKEDADVICEGSDPELVASSSCEWEPPAEGDYLLTLAVFNGSGSDSSDWALSVGTGPRITSFTMTPEVLNFGEEVLINWTVLPDPNGDVPALSLRDSEGNAYPLPTGQRFARIPLNQATGDLEFTLQAETDHPLSIADEAQAHVVVHGLPAVTLQANPTHFDDQTEEARLSWTSANAASLVLYEVVGDTLVEMHSVPEAERADGSFGFVPLADAAYRLIATNAMGTTAEAEVTITVQMPEVLTFTADKSVVVAGQPVLLSWTTHMATDVSLSIFSGTYVREETEEVYVDAQAAGGTAIPLGTACGTPVLSLGCATLTFPAGFSFPFGGTNHTSVLVHKNGYLSFDPPGPDASSTHSGANQRFPAGETPFVHLAPFWDGLGWDGARYPQGNLHYLLRTDPAGDSLIIQWKDVGFASSMLRTASLNFQVVLWENGDFEYRYGEMSAGPAPASFARGSSATIGYQLPDRSEYDNRNFNTSIPVRGVIEGRTFVYHRTPELPASGSYLWHPYATQETVSVNLLAERGAASHSKNVTLTVHARPDITVQRPELVGVDEDGVIEWETNFATAVEVVDSQGVKRCEAENQDEVNAGSCVFQEAEEGIYAYRIRATGALGYQIEKTVEIKVHEPFGIVSFDADQSLVERGQPVTLTWVTDNAPHIVLLRNGEVVLPDGSVDPAGSLAVSDITEDTTFLLRVTNGIGIVVERSVFVEAWKVQFALTPSSTSIRPGQTASIEIESKGLNGAEDGPIFGTFPMAEVTDEGSLFQNVARAGVVPLSMSSRSTGYANVNLPSGFSFPYYGERYRSLRVYVEGYVSFNTAATGTGTNRLLPDSGSSYLNVHLAPFWDDFNMHTKGEIYAVQTDPDTFVIQWTGMSLTTGSTSGTNEYDINFQLVLFRDGSFEYRYGTMAPSPNGSTSCRPNDCTHEVMASSATIGYQSPGGITGYNLHFGGGSSADTNPTIPLANRTFRYEPKIGTASVEVSPTKTQTYIYCTETGIHPICRSIDILAEFGIDSFGAVSDIIDFGSSATLTWKTRGGTRLRILDGDNQPIFLLDDIGEYDRIDEGSFVVNPLQNATYTLELSATDNAASATQSIEVVRIRVTAETDVSESFPGAPVELEWTVRNADPSVTPVVIMPLEEVQSHPFSALDISADPEADTIHAPIGTTSRISPYTFDTGFDFDFMGSKKTSVMVSTSGYLSFDSSTSNSTANAELPSTSTAPKRVHIAPFWDSLYTRQNGRVIAKRIDVDTYVIQWSGLSYSSGSSTSVEHNINFMVVLHRNGDFEFRYGTMRGLESGTSTACQPNPSNCDNEANGSSATIGYQNELGTAGFSLHHATTTSQLRSFPGGLENRTFRYTRTSTGGTVTVTPYDSTVYNVCAMDPGSGDVFCSDPVLVEAKWGISEFEANPWAPVRGDEVTLSWKVVGLDTLVLRAGATELGSWTRPSIPEDFSIPHIPTANTTYTLEGTSMGRSVRVDRSIEIRGFSLDLQTPPARIFPGGSGTINWNATQHEDGDFHLVTPMSELPAGPGQPGAFVDRSGEGATKVTITGSATSGSAVVTIPFSFPYFGTSYTTARVFVDGFISFDSSSASGNGTNAALPYNSSTYRLHLAPFWDDLNLLDPDVDSIWTWTAPGDESFVIQWKSVNRTGATLANRYDLNFQVILYPDGSFEYRYGEMKALPTKVTSNCYSEDCVPEANGSSATIGYQTQNWTYAQQFHFGGNTAAASVVLDGGLENRTFRFDPRPVGSASIRLPQSKDVQVCGFFTGTGGFSECKEISLKTVADPGDLTITELMIDPTGGVDEQWFEVRNLTREPIDLNGFEIAATGGSYTINQALPVAPGAYVALAASASVGFTPDLTYTDVAMNPVEDTFALRAGTASISSVTWTSDWTIPAGRSLSLDPSYHMVGNASNDDEARWCTEISTGTPKARGEGCRNLFYDVDPTSDRAFVDISSTGTRVFDLESASSIARIDAPGFSMPYFDGVASRVWVAQNGWISFSSSDPAGGSASSPSSVPRTGTTAPAGPLVAAYWGTLRCDNSLYPCDFRWEQRTLEGQTVLILQWTGFRWSTANGSITLQAQLWEQGDVVVAFGDVYSNDSPGSTNWNNYHGNTAWVGLEGFERSEILSGHHRSVIDLAHRTFHFIRK